MIKINKCSPDKHKYLQILNTLAKKPKTLYYRGELPDQRRPTVAVVGSRKPTAYGRQVTDKIASELASRGIVIVSGLALGIDSIAHRAALDAGGTTLAVLANGVDDITPRSHQSLGEDIIKRGGAILSEYEPGTPAYPSSFLERNRIVSGLSDAVLITEAAQRSGTLSTAAHALEQGKDVFVVPGNITSPMSSGCNNLIRQGALVATSAEDIIAQIAPDKLQSQTSITLGANPTETAIIKLLQAGWRSGDEIQTKLQLDTSQFNQAMTMMEINGLIRSLGGNQWTLR